MALGQVTRTAGGVLGGFVLWWVVATIVDIAVRLSWPDYAAVEKAMTFTLGMQVARLANGAVSSLAAGFATAWISRRKPIATGLLVILLLALFIPVHISLWAKFPAWYHLIFFASLLGFPFVSLHRPRFGR